MAKKIRLDFSKTEERSGWNTKQIAEGLHKMKIVDVEVSEAQDGTEMLIYALVPADPRYKTRRFPYYCKLQQNQMWKLRDLLIAAGETVPKKALQIDPAKVVGKHIAAEVEDDMYQGNIKSQVQGTYGLEILDGEDGPATDDDDENDDETDADYEDEDDAEEGEWEDEEDDEDEEENLADMSISELRTYAKSLGLKTGQKSRSELLEDINTAKPEGEDDSLDDDSDVDEDDLGNEELEESDFDDEDDDFDDEDDEPAPAKKRAPVKRVSAPAKRAVKRR